MDSGDWVTPYLIRHSIQNMKLNLFRNSLTWKGHAIGRERINCIFRTVKKAP